MLSKIKQKMDNISFKLRRNVEHLKKGIDINHEWYGNDYAGFYVCPDLLNKDSIVYSFGIGEDISFDKVILDKHHCQGFGFDPTPKSIDWIEHQNLPANFSFYPVGISNITEQVNFYLPTIEENVSGSIVKHRNVTEKRKVQVPMKCLGDIVKELEHKRIDILKMDIEGSEYDVIESLFDAGVLIDQLLIEFHDRFFEEGSKKSLASIKFLLEKGYEIFGVSDSYEEISLIRKNAI